MRNLIERENEIFNILEKLSSGHSKFIVVGGYAVSAYKHRFSVDADIVIKEKELEIFEKILKNEGFKKQQTRDLSDIYASKFVRYEKKSSLISVDLLINALVSRTTNASFSFELLLQNSKIGKIIGAEKEIKVRIPNKEILTAMKLHSGRLTDFRDIAALAKGTSIEKIQQLIKRGDATPLKTNLIALNKTIKDNNFIDSFKGVFSEKKFDIDTKQLEKISKLYKQV